jgi:hypothetical protein
MKARLVHCAPISLQQQVTSRKHVTMPVANRLICSIPSTLIASTTQASTQSCTDVQRLNFLKGLPEPFSQTVQRNHFMKAVSAAQALPSRFPAASALACTQQSTMLLRDNYSKYGLHPSAQSVAMIPVSPLKAAVHALEQTHSGLESNMHPGTSREMSSSDNSIATLLRELLPRPYQTQIPLPAFNAHKARCPKPASRASKRSMIHDPTNNGRTVMNCYSQKKQRSHRTSSPLCDQPFGSPSFEALQSKGASAAHSSFQHARHLPCPAPTSSTAAAARNSHATAMSTPFTHSFQSTREASTATAFLGYRNSSRTATAPHSYSSSGKVSTQANALAMTHHEAAMHSLSACASTAPIAVVNPFPSPAPSAVASTKTARDQASNVTGVPLAAMLAQVRHHQKAAGSIQTSTIQPCCQELMRLLGGAPLSQV